MIASVSETKNDNLKNMPFTVYMRRLFIRKRRCFLFIVSVILISILLYSWQQTTGLPDPLEREKELQVPDVRVLTPVHPKFVVLEQPGPIPNTNINKENSQMEPPKVEPVQKDLVLPAKDALSSDSKGEQSHVKKAIFNKTQVNEKVKNESLSQLGVIGEKDSEKRIPKIKYIKAVWNLSVSFEDIGNIMKDTAFLNKLKPLNLSGPMLISTRNRTSNFSLSMPIKMGYCDCWERYCFCCVQISNEQLHLNNKTCANFTFMSKSHELGIDFHIDNKKVFTGTVSADAPPLLCLGSIPSVSDLCIHFSNMTYKVDRHGLHKSQILGCTDFTLNMYNKTLSVFPVDCFQIPGDPNHHRKEEHVILPNFVP